MGAWSPASFFGRPVCLMVHRCPCFVARSLPCHLVDSEAAARRCKIGLRRQRRGRRGRGMMASQRHGESVSRSCAPPGGWQAGTWLGSGSRLGSGSESGSGSRRWAGGRTGRSGKRSLGLRRGASRDDGVRMPCYLVNVVWGASMQGKERKCPPDGVVAPRVESSAWWVVRRPKSKRASRPRDAKIEPLRNPHLMMRRLNCLLANSIWLA